MFKILAIELMPYLGTIMKTVETELCIFRLLTALMLIVCQLQQVGAAFCVLASGKDDQLKQRSVRHIFQLNGREMLVPKVCPLSAIKYMEHFMMATDRLLVELIQH